MPARARRNGGRLIDDSYGDPEGTRTFAKLLTDRDRGLGSF